ncbi:hypothetical protein [Microbacterium enclense]|uniref:hypothetical protein n=1 Tax=Microbacterium enclense TaxID=993073 RepID=UPI00341CEC6B
MADFDFSSLDKLAADLGTVSRDTQKNVRKAVEVTARKVKDSWRDKLKGSSTLPGLPSAVSYDVKSASGAVEAEVGFDKGRRQGALGNVSEFGTPSVGPRGFGLASLEENRGDFEDGIGIALAETLEENGL